MLVTTSSCAPAQSREARPISCSSDSQCPRLPSSSGRCITRSTFLCGVTSTDIHIILQITLLQGGLKAVHRYGAVNKIHAHSITVINVQPLNHLHIYESCLPLNPSEIQYFGLLLQLKTICSCSGLLTGQLWSCQYKTCATCVSAEDCYGSWGSSRLH